MRDLVSFAYDRACEVTGQEKLHRSKEEVLAELDRILGVSRVTVQFFLDMSSPKMTDFKLRVDPRRTEVLGVSARFTDHKNSINRVLRAMR
jgi:hypothetical protein